MHDPNTVAFEIKYPWRDRSHGTTKLFPNGYRRTFITIWHVDPCKRGYGGSDDTCGWFMRAHHCDQDTLNRIVKRFESDWDRTFVSKPETGDEPFPEKTYFCGLFYPEDAGAGMPNMGVTAIVLNLFFLAACEHFKVDGRNMWKPARRYMQRRLFDIMLFAENPTDSLRDEIVRKWGTSTNREDRIRNLAGIIYSWICRDVRPWYKHPRFHFWHWKFQVHPWQTFRRWALSRCCRCGKRFKWGESPVTDCWDFPKPKLLRGETHIYHADCSNPGSQPCSEINNAPNPL